MGHGSLLLARVPRLDARRWLISEKPELGRIPTARPGSEARCRVWAAHAA